MKLPIYQVDAFASRLFSGNPAAPLGRLWPKRLFPAKCEGDAVQRRRARNIDLSIRRDQRHAVRFDDPVHHEFLAAQACQFASYVELY